MARKLSTPKMKALLKRGLKKASEMKHPPSDGMLISLINEDDLAGWHYQVEWVNDTRFYKCPRVIVYAWSSEYRKNNSGSSFAQYYLYKSKRGK